MIDRLSTFSNPEVIELLKTRFIPATDNDWFNRRRKDAAGDFFLSVAKQGPRGEGNGTKQGHYILTASGKLLGFNNNRSIERRMAFINDALAKWDALPAAGKRPGAVSVPPLDPSKADARYHAEPPGNGVVLVASERLLKRDAKGAYSAIGPDDHDHSWGHLAAVDRMWIQDEEWQALLKAGKAGGPVPARLTHRLLRYHLMDFTRGEPPFWKREEIRDAELIIEPGGAANRFRLRGSAKLATADGKRGYQPKLAGVIEIAPNGSPTRVDLLAIGDHWGQGTYTPGARPGRTPLGIAFRLADPDKPADKVRPQASHWLKGYWEAEKH